MEDGLTAAERFMLASEMNIQDGGRHFYTISITIIWRRVWEWHNNMQ